jgi:hypothetical protein
MALAITMITGAIGCILLIKSGYSVLVVAPLALAWGYFVRSRLEREGTTK